MIVCTKNADAISRRGFGRTNVAVQVVDKLLGLLKLDPNIQQPKKEAFILSADDFRNNPRLLNEFEEALAHKHKDAYVILITRNAKHNFTKEMGIDEILISPKPEELAKIVSVRIMSISSKGMIEGGGNTVDVGPNVDISMQNNTPYAMPVTNPEPQPEPTAPEDFTVNLEGVEEAEPAEEMPQESDNLLDRIRNCGNVADVNVIANEIKAAEVIKNLIAENQQYASMEQKLRGLQEKIQSILMDEQIPNVEDKLEKVRAVMYDKNYFKAKTDAVIEQYIETIILEITGKTMDLLNKRLADLDRALAKRGTVDESDLDWMRFAGIKDERSNVILELAVLDKEIRNIYQMTDTLAADTAAGMVAEPTTEANIMQGRMQLLQDHMKSRGISAMSQGSLESLINILATTEKTSPQFQKALQDISVEQKKLNQLLALDREQLVASSEIIRYLSANHMEDTVVAQSFIKKALRVYVAEECTGSTVIPLVIADAQSRTAANSLLVDLTGYGKYDLYGQQVINLDDWMENRTEQALCVVQAEASPSVEAMQRLLVALTKEAIFYKCINLVINPADTDLIEFLANEPLSINYIVSTDTPVIERMAAIIADNKAENVAKNVIVNKFSGNLGPISRALGVFDRMDVHISSIDYVAQIVNCAFTHIKPSTVNSVNEAFKEVIVSAQAR